MSLDAFNVPSLEQGGPNMFQHDNKAPCETPHKCLCFRNGILTRHIWVFWSGIHILLNIWYVISSGHLEVRNTDVQDADRLIGWHRVSNCIFLKVTNMVLINQKRNIAHCSIHLQATIISEDFSTSLLQYAYNFPQPIIIIIFFFCINLFAVCS